MAHDRPHAPARRTDEDDRLLDWLWRTLYSADGRHAECPRCGRPRTFHRVRGRPSYSCDACGWHLHPTAGTIMQGSHVPISSWFSAITRVVADPEGTSAGSLGDDPALSRRSAARMVRLTRTVLDARDDDRDARRQADLLAAISAAATSGWSSVPSHLRHGSEPGDAPPSPRPAPAAGAPPADPRARILEGACRAVVKRGMGACRVADIAREAGVSSAVVHYHFATKDAVLMEATRWVERETLAERDAILQADVSPARKLGYLLEEQRLRNELSRQEIILYIGLWGRAMRSADYRAESTRSRHKWRAYFGRILREGVASGDFHLRAPLDDVVECLTAFLDGITIQVLVGHPWLDEERAAELTFKVFADQTGVTADELRAAADEWAAAHSSGRADPAAHPDR